MKTPYTYLIGWKNLNKWYYGVRFAKNCHPDEFWVSYHTSSKDVKVLREQFGEPNVIEIRRVFESRPNTYTSDDARLWEHKVLRRTEAVRKKEWVNRGNGGVEFNTEGKINRTTFKAGIEHPFYGKPAWNKGKHSLPEKERQRRSERYKGEGNPNFGRKHSEETKRKVSEMRKRVGGTHLTPHSEESKEKIKQNTKERNEYGLFLFDM
jgi:hypothetical protein